MPVGSYRLLVYGQTNTAIHDLAGLRLDGNNDGLEGGDYQSVFRVNNRPDLLGLNTPTAIPEDVSNIDNSGTTIQQLLGSFRLDSDGPGRGLAVVNASDTNGQWQYSTDGAGQLAEGNSSLQDGNYELIIRASSIRRAGSTGDAGLLDGDQDGMAGGDRLFGSDANNHAVAADAFFRLFGDTNGDGVVGIAEFGQFRSAFGKTSADAGYDALFDFESDGAVGISDFGQFRARFGKSRFLY